MADSAMRDELVKWLVGDAPDQGDRYMAERLVDAASGVCGECGTEEDTKRVVRLTLSEFIDALRKESVRREKAWLASADIRPIHDVVRAIDPKSRPICLCPAAEYDPPCPRHGILGIGVTGRD